MTGRKITVRSSAADSVLELTVLGGLRSKSVNASYGLARLDCFGWGIRLRSSARWLRWLLPAWEARYDELVKAQLITVPLGNRGVRFQPADGTSPIIFWTFKGSIILDQLEAHGVTVNRNVTRLRHTGGLRQQL